MSEIHSLYYRDWDSAYIPHILKEIYIDKVYDRFFVGRKGLTVVDLGANIGLFSVYAAKFAQRIIAVEPDPNHCEVLDKNLSQIKGLKYEIIQKAVAVVPGKKTFFRNPDNSTANTLLGGNTSEGFEVDVVTVDTIFKDIDAVDFLKIDIEGSEFEVIGGKEFDVVASKIDKVVGEMHAWAGRNYNQMKDSLKNRGFKVGVLKTDASLFVGEK